MLDLIQGDSLEVMSASPGASVDLIFADPPFNIGKKYGEAKAGDDRLPESRQETGTSYYAWCARWIAEGFRMLKDTGTFYLMTISRHVIPIGEIMYSFGVYVNKVEWRNVSANHGKRGFWPSTQPILVFGKTDKYKFHTYAQRKKTLLRRWGGYTTAPQGQLLDYWDDIPFVYAGSVSHPEAILKPGTYQKQHPTQMPVALVARCIQFSTDPGDLVLDPFNGSGTTGAACYRLGRNYVGIEREAEYVEMSRRRWRQLEQQPMLDDVIAEVAWTSGSN